MRIQKVISLAVVGVFGFGFVCAAGYAEPTGTVKGRMKIYDANGYTHQTVNEDAKARLYKKSGKRVDSDKVSKSGRFKFEDVTAGEKYYIRCTADGYVNAKKTEKAKYKTGTFEVKDGKTVKKNCRMTLAE